MRILVVDDSRVMRSIVIRTMRQAGFGHHEYEQAEDGAAALERVRIGDIDFVITDLNMPGLTGLELAAAVQSEGLETPIGFVTSVATDENRHEALRKGARFVLTKPFTADVMRETLSPWLGDP